MPSEGWPATTFAALISRGALQIGDGHRAKLAELGGDGPIFFRAGLLSAAGINLDAADRFKSDVEVPLAKFAQAGDTFVTTKGNSVGRPGFLPQGLPPLVYSPHLSYWRSTDKEAVHPQFLRYWARSPEFLTQLRAMAHGTDMAPYLSLVDQKRLTISLPPIDVQRHIAAVLCALDDKIDSNRRLAAILEDTTATLFRARFVDFVGIEEFEDSEIGPIPLGWTVEPVGSVVMVKGGSTPSTKQRRFWDGQNRWATPKDLAGSRSPVLLNTRRHITDQGVDQISSRQMPPRTVLLSSRAPVGYTAISFCPISVNQGFIAIPPLPGMPSEFVLFWLRENLDLIKQHAGGTTFAEISKSQFRPLPMLVPPQDELDRFAATSVPAFDKIAALERESTTLEAIRETLLPKLVSGAVGVSEAMGPASAAVPAGVV